MKILPASFNPTDTGTAEALWQELLESQAPWEPNAGAVVVVSPHPDDELLGAGGLIRQWVLSGHSVTVLSVTDGERAYPHWAGLDVVRRRELTEALRLLVPVHVAIRRVGIPDGEVENHLNRLRSALLQVLDETTTIVAPYEHDGHPDHEATARVCLEVAQASRLSVVRYPIWLWHRGTTAMLSGLSWGKYELNGDSQRAKRRAVECFVSQIRPPLGEPILPPNVLEYFSRPYEAFIV